MIFLHCSKIFEPCDFLFSPFEVSIDFGIRCVVYNLLREVIILELRNL